MERFTIFKRDDTQILPEFFNVKPMADPAIGLRFFVCRLSNRLFTPFQTNIRALLQHPTSEIRREFHVYNLTIFFFKHNSSMHKICSHLERDAEERIIHKKWFKE